MLRVVRETAYAAIRLGLRVPRNDHLAQLGQLGDTIDLLRRHGVTHVLDVGANRGTFARDLRRAGYAGAIICFEPIMEECARIDALAAEDPLWTCHRCALGAENATKSFNVMQQPGAGGSTVFSSFLSAQRDLGVSSHPIMVEMRRLDDFLTELLPDLGAARIFLKMDTQGYDLAVFEGARGILAQVRMLQSEIAVEPLYVGMPPYTSALATYHEAGFGLYGLYTVHRTRDDNVLEYDCLMQRPSD